MTVAGAGGITMNVARTVGGLFQYAAGVSNMGNLTLNGTSQVNAGGFTSGSPTYGSSSLLKYNINASYGRNGEWLPNVTSGAGYPANVQLSNNTNLDLPNGSAGAAFQLASNLTIDSGSTMNLNGSPAMTQPLTVLNAVTINGTLNLSTAPGGDLHLQGGWTNVGGTFNPNGRAVFFEGGLVQTLSHTAAGGETFNYLVINKTSNSVQLTTDVTVNATSGDALQLLGGAAPLDLGSKSLNMSGAGGNLLVSGGARTVVSSFNPGAFNFTGAKTVTNSAGGTLSFSSAVNVYLIAGVNFGAGLTTINGALQVSTGGFVNTNAPTYATNSTLSYVSSGTYGRSTEWSATSGAGYPYNVILSNNTTLDMGANGGGPVVRQMAGSLIVNSGSTFTMAATPMSATVTVLGSVTNGGTLVLSTASGGDLKLQGAFTNQTGGTFTPNNRAVFFEGSATQNLTDASGALSIPYIVVNKSGGTVRLNATDLSALAPSGGTSINFVGGTSTLTLNGRTLTLGSSIGNTPAGSGFIGDASASMSLQDGGSAGSMGTLTFVSGSQNLQNLTVNRTGGAGSVILGSNLTVGGMLSLTTGQLLTDTNTLTIAGTGTVTRTSGYIIGTEQKTFTSGGNFTFDVGTANGYSPVNANNTTGAGSLSVKPTQTKQPNITGTNALTRYWTLTGAGITTDLTFHYLATDVVGTESNYQVVKYNGTFSTPPNQTVTAGTHTATVNSVNSFSDWTLAEPASVFGSLQFSSATYTDNETNATHNVTITVTRTGATSGAVTVHYATSDGTATTANNDYTATSGDLNFADGDISKTFNVSVTGDATQEPDETVNLTLSAPTGGAVLGTPSAAVLTITNDDVALPNTVYVDDDWVGLANGTDPDGAGPATSIGFDAFAMIQGGIDGVAANGTVNVAAGNYAEQPVIGKSLTLHGAGASTTNISAPNTLAPRFGNFFILVEVNGGAVVEASGITVKGPLNLNGCPGTTSASRRYYGVYVRGGAALNLHDSSVLDIRENNPAGNTRCTVGTAVDVGSTVVAPNQTGTLTLDHTTITGFQARAVTVDKTGSAATITNNTLTGSTSPSFVQTVILVAVGASANISGNQISGAQCSDAVNCGPDTFNQAAAVGISLTAPANGTQVSNNTISNNDYGINYVAAPGDTSVISGNTFNANRYFGINNSEGNLTVSNNTFSGASNVAVAAVSVNDPNNQTASNSSATLTGNTITGATVGLQLLDQTGFPADSFFPQLTAHFNRIVATTTAIDNPQSNTSDMENNWWGCNAGPGNTGCGAVTGTGVDFNPWLVLAAFATPNSIAPGGTANVAADMTHNSDGAVPSLAPPNMPISFSATNGTMNPTSAPLTAGAASSMFTSTNASNATATTAVDNQNVNTPITVNAPTFTIDDVTHQEGNGGTTAYTFTVTKMGTTSLNATVDYATVDGTAIAPSDYTAITTTTLTFLPADTTKQVTVLVNGDTTFEPDEAFTVHLSNPVNANIGDADGTGTIQNDDTAGTLKFSATSYSTAEGNSGTHTATINVQRTGSMSGAIGVHYATSNGTAAAGSDYVATSGDLSWADGDSADKAFTVTINGDTTFEGDEFLNLTLSAPTGGATLGSPSTARLFITDDDTAPIYLVNTTDDNNDGACNAAHCSLREAINAANAAPGQINFAANVTGQINLLTFLPTLSSNYININGPGASVLTVRRDNSAGNIGVFFPNSAGTITISGLTVSNASNTNGIRYFGTGTLNITGSVVTGNNSGIVGGAGLFTGSTGTVNITNSTFSNNSANGGEGGAIRLDGTGDLNITGSTFSGNSATNLGCIHNNNTGTVTINNTLITGNSATFDAGGINNGNNGPGTLVVMNSTIKNNTAGNVGGGIKNGGTGSVTIIDSTIDGNTATNSGGGIFNTTTGTINVTRSTISNNSSGSGGGISNDRGTVNVTNSTISTNHASGVGGGLQFSNFNGQGTGNITSSTITGNTATTGGGIFVANGGPVTIKNTIIAGNTANNPSPNIFGTLTSGGYNLIGNNLGGTIMGTTGDQIGTSSSPINPQLGALQTNGGPTFTHALLSNSPALDAGHSFSLMTDQRGFARTVDQTSMNVGDGTDIGAFEAQAAPASITATAGTPQSATVSTTFATQLQATVKDASNNGVGGVSVTFTAPASGASGTFPGSMTSATVITDAGGIATAPVFTANSMPGNYTVTAQTSPAVAMPASFDLTNAALPSFSIDDVTHMEGNSGTTMFVFTITKTGAGAASVEFTNVDGSATVAGNDYTANSGTLSFTSAQTVQTITVLVHGDHIIESDETFTVHLSNAMNATIGDSDGTGTIQNDDTTQPNTVYVDDDFTGALGTDPDGAGGPATEIGFDAFPTIQGGVNGVAPGGTVNVAAGTYAENVTVNKSLSLLGPNANIDPNTGTRVPEANVLPAVTETSLQGSTSGTIFRVGTASGHVNVTIKGLTIDGHNSALTGGRTLNGVEINTGAGIVNSIDSFDANPNAFDATMDVQNNIIQNLERYGVLADNVPARTPAAGTDVSHNKIDNLPSGNNFGGGRGRAIAFEENLYGSATFNVITRVNVGWQDDDYNLASPGAATLVSHNTIHTYHRGIFHNLQYQAASNATFSNNDIFVETSGDFPASSTNFGLELSSIQSAVGATVTNNNVTGNVYGILLWNLATTADITVTGGTLTGNNYGVYATSTDPQFGTTSDHSHSIVSGVTVTGSTVMGVFVDAGNSLALHQNSIFANTGLGIDLGGDGVTANDDKDTDTGANNLQNFPVITAATVTGSTRNITGTLNSTPGQTFTLEFYKNDACDVSGNGEGKTYIGSLTTDTTATDGNVSFTFHPATLNAGDIITATTTDDSGNTSEFSQCVTAQGGSAGFIAFTSPSSSVPENVAGGMAAIIVSR
ncbi:MAG: beta strand repeat-containing protein, partial [Pyrinomonadaceae bacterium]